MKRIVRLILVFALVFLVLPNLAPTASAAASGTCGENMTWKLSSGTLTISGTGAMEDYEYGTSPWYENRTSVEKLVIEDGVTQIGDSAFYRLINMTEVTIPTTVTYMGKYAFFECEKLTDIYISDLEAWAKISYERYLTGPTEANELGKHLYLNGVLLTELPGDLTYIGNYAFSHCADLTELVIPEGVTTIGEFAFADCENLKSVTFHDKVSSVGWGAFMDCGSLEAVYASSLKEWVQICFESINANPLRNGGSLYLNGKLLTELKLTDKVSQINSYSFEGYDKLTKVTLGDSVKSIGSGAFSECHNLTSVTIGDNVSSMGDSVFYNCFNLKSVDIGGTFEKLGISMFYRCSSLESVKLPDSIKTMFGWDAFDYCTSLTAITLPGSLTEIGDSSFTECTSLKTVVIPASVTVIKDNAFNGCGALSDVYYCGTPEQKKKIEIREYNEDILDAKWHYNYVEVPKITVSGNTTTGKPRLSWDAAYGATRFRVYRATSKSGTYSYLDSTASQSFTDTTAKAGTNYYYKVKAMNGDTPSAYSNIVNRVCDLKKPVVTLKVDTASGKPKVTFEKISGAEKYYIVRATSKSGTYTKLATVTGTSYIDKTAKAGKTYYYKVKALHEKDAADSAYSAVTSRVCDLKKPVVTIKCNSSGDPYLKWEAVSGAEKYEVYRATSKTGTYKLVKTTVTATSFADRNATAGKTYYYKVRAIHEKEAANSAYSTIKYVKAK